MVCGMKWIINYRTNRIKPGGPWANFIIDEMLIPTSECHLSLRTGLGYWLMVSVL